MQSFKRIFSERKKVFDEEQIVQLLNKNDIDDLNDVKVSKLIEPLSDTDLLYQYLDIGNTEHDESGEDDIMYQIRKLKAVINMRIPKHTLILFVSDDLNDKHIDGSKDDNCDYHGGCLIGMVVDKVDLLKNVDIDIHIQLYQNNGNIERRDLVASYLNCEATDKISLHNEWRFWLLTTGEQKGFYKDFWVRHTYVIFPTHPLYNMLKRLYEMPKK